MRRSPSWSITQPAAATRPCKSRWKASRACWKRRWIGSARCWSTSRHERAGPPQARIGSPRGVWGSYPRRTAVRRRPRLAARPPEGGSGAVANNRPPREGGGAARAVGKPGGSMIRTVLRMGDPRLWQPSKPVEAFNTPTLDSLLADLRDTMAAENGAGLAAPQIGVPLQVVIFGFAENPRYPDA